MRRESQNQRIDEINEKLYIMTNIVKEQIKGSMQALKLKDEKLAENIIKNDDKVDNLQKVIEEECIKFIATEQLVAKDLRRVFTASKIVTDLERMADHAIDICKIVKYVKGTLHPIEIKDLLIMEEKIQNMITLASKAYTERDIELAYSICKLDDEIDNLYKQTFKYTLLCIKNDENSIEEGTRLLFVAKYLERIGDHVTNICEWIIFSKTGEYVDLNI